MEILSLCCLFELTDEFKEGREDIDRRGEALFVKEFVLAVKLVRREGEDIEPPEGGTDLDRDERVRGRGLAKVLALSGDSILGVAGSTAPSCHCKCRITLFVAQVI